MAVRRWWQEPPAGATVRAIKLTTGILYLCGALSCAIAVALLPVTAEVRLAILGLSAVAVLIGLGLLWRGERLPRWTYHVNPLFGTGAFGAFVLLVGADAPSAALVAPFLVIVVNIPFLFALPSLAVHLAIVFGVAGALLAHLGEPVGAITLNLVTWLSVAAVATYLARLTDALEEDQLTGLPNRRGFARRFDQLLLACGRDGTPLTLAMLDLDRFKDVNDLLGEETADRILVDCARAWGERLPANATLARCGGDGFGLLLPGRHAGEAAVLVNDLLSFTAEEVTASAGISQWQPGESANQLKRRADDALYDAKRSGRDRAVIFGRPSGAAPVDGDRAVDPVTGVPFYERSEEGQSWFTSAALVIEVDNYLATTQVVGFEAGDLLLLEAAERIDAEIEGLDARVRRLQGPHFLVLVSADSVADVRELGDRLAYTVDRQPTGLAGQRGGLTVGVALAARDGSDVTTLIRSAMTAAAYAKRDQPGTAVFFEPDMAEDARDRLALSRALRNAIEQREITLVYQPQVRVCDGVLAGVEVLARWTEPERGPIPPGRFVRLAEQMGMSRSFDRMILDMALEQLRAWDDAGVRIPRISVNAMAETVSSGTISDNAPALLARHGVEPERLTIELLENRLLDEERGAAMLHRIRDLGVRVSLDDFGTGYSSFGQLVSLPVDELKIDRTFLVDHGGSGVDVTVIGSMIQVGKALGLDVIAEGIETVEQRDRISDLDCPVGQGRFFAPPMPADELARWVAARDC